ATTSSSSPTAPGSSAGSARGSSRPGSPHVLGELEDDPGERDGTHERDEVRRARDDDEATVGARAQEPALLEAEVVPLPVDEPDGHVPEGGEVGERVEVGHAGEDRVHDAHAHPTGREVREGRL